MKIIIPSYHRGKKQRTLEFLRKIGCPKNDIFICIQDESDIAEYESYNEFCNVVYFPAHNVAGNRNNAMTMLQTGERAILMDDNIRGVSVYRGNKFVPVQDFSDFASAMNDAFDYCVKNNAKVFVTTQGNNEFFAAKRAERSLYSTNAIGGCIFGIIKSDIMFDESFDTKEDYDFLLAHRARGENTVLLNGVCFKKTYHEKGGCFEVHNSEVERKTAKKLYEKYPQYVEIVDQTEVKFVKSCPETYNSPRFTGEIMDCSLPVTLDTYSNCSFGCVYCFSQYQRGIGSGKQNYNTKKVSSINPDRIRRLFSGEYPDSEFWGYLKDRRPIQYGGLSDQFDGYEKKHGKTYETLKYLRELNYPICFSTKSAWVFFDDKYRELFRGADNWNMKFSIITLDEADAAKIEVGVPSPRKRLEAMAEYNKLSKGGTTLRLRPFIIGVTDKTYLDLIKAARDAGANAVTTEFFCLEMRAINLAKEHYKAISDVCGFDIVEFYREHSNGSGYLRLNRKIKEPYIRKMQELCKELGMRFYVSDAHFKECSENCCCCALPPEWGYSRGHFAAALQIAKKKGVVHFSDIEADMDWMPSKQMVRTGCNVARQSSESRAMFSGLTMKEFIRYFWNNPKRGQSPYKIFSGVLVPDGYDENHDIIYKYNKDVTFQPVTNMDYELKRL